MLLQMLVYSAYQLAGLGVRMSIAHVTRLKFYGGAGEQLVCLKTILSGLAKKGKRDDNTWVADRAKLMWLWSWGIDPDDENAIHGAGCLGSIDKEDFEEEMLKVFTETSCKFLRMLFFSGPTRCISLPTAKLTIRVRLRAFLLITDLTVCCSG